MYYLIKCNVNVFDPPFIDKYKVIKESETKTSSRLQKMYYEYNSVDERLFFWFGECFHRETKSEVKEVVGRYIINKRINKLNKI